MKQIKLKWERLVRLSDYNFVDAVGSHKSDVKTMEKEDERHRICSHLRRSQGIIANGDQK